MVHRGVFTCGGQTQNQSFRFVLSTHYRPGGILHPGDRTVSKPGSVSAKHPTPERTVSWEFLGRGETEKYGRKENDASKDNTWCGEKLSRPKRMGERRMGNS